MKIQDGFYIFIFMVFIFNIEIQPSRNYNVNSSLFRMSSAIVDHLPHASACQRSVIMHQKNKKVSYHKQIARQHSWATE